MSQPKSATLLEIERLNRESKRYARLAVVLALVSVAINVARLTGLV